MNRVKLVICLMVLILNLICQPLQAELLDRVVAIVNDDIILLSEFEEVLKLKSNETPVMGRERVLEEMVNDILLLAEAKKTTVSDYGIMKRWDVNNQLIIEEFIDWRIRSFIHIPLEDIEYYYLNSINYSGKSLTEVRDEINKMLVEKELKIKLAEFIVNLRSRSRIRIQLEEE